ncbi:hypothetical protein [Paenibacillus sp. YPG26]|uniref:hypothetical protein n=1 Tax=Paenibacillus sp. YPG26 TaxID=2878915 RepID=UPI00203F1FAA|nr:hypothetical protein [Paenibacillus sp. YPG26]USB33611.1 hypothetical protein LDO05_01940 [Paenibacillus sp. YPG26]
MVKRIYLLLLVCGWFLAGCTNSREANLEHTTPDGPTTAMTIAIVGDGLNPVIRNVSYVPVELEDLGKVHSRSFDGLIIFKDKFDEAAQPKNKQFFKSIDYPVFFIGAEEILTAAFYSEDITLDQVKGTRSGPYASGFVRAEEGGYRTWDIDLPNNPTDKDKGLNTIIRICNIIEDYKRTK